MVTTIDLSMQAVDQDAANDFKELKKFVVNLKTAVESSNIRKNLIDVFEREVSEQYFQKAKTFVEKFDTPHERSQEYNKVLNRLKDHALFLAEFTQSHAATVLPAKSRTSLEKMLGIISKRISSYNEPPFLMPLLSSDFKYVHFNYLNSSIGFVGIPPQIAADPLKGKNLSILWHEVAGHAIARARRSQEGDKLKKWADELKKYLGKKLWADYRALYITSILENLPIKDQIKQAEEWKTFKELYQKQVLKEEAVEANQEWQATWLAEFLEDLFWIIVFEGKRTGTGEIDDTLIRILRQALMPSYSDLAIGDYEHPPVDLRMLVGLAYLDPDNFRVTRKKRAIYSDKPNLLDLAGPIAAVCRGIIRSGELYQPVVSPEEKELATNLIKQPVPDSVEEMLKGMPAGKALSSRIGADAFLEQINRAGDLEALLALDFTENDNWRGQRGAFRPRRHGRWHSPWGPF